jgi:hypothetical protein
MNTKNLVSNQTRNNWLIDVVLLCSAIVASLSGIYFLFLPTGGYRGGRNPFYDLQILFNRSTWEDLHTWGGVAMIAIAVVHIPLHWNWIVTMTRKALLALTSKGGAMSKNGRLNLAINITIGLSFLISALTGLYFFLIPGASHGSGATDPGFLFNRVTWDLIHTWASAVMIAAAVLHFAIHWKWVTKVTTKILNALGENVFGRLKSNRKFAQTPSK